MAREDQIQRNLRVLCASKLLDFARFFPGLTLWCDCYPSCCWRRFSPALHLREQPRRTRSARSRSCRARPAAIIPAGPWPTWSAVRARRWAPVLLPGRRSPPDLLSPSCRPGSRHSGLPIRPGRRTRRRLNPSPSDRSRLRARAMRVTPHSDAGRCAPRDAGSVRDRRCRQVESRKERGDMPWTENFS